MTIACESSRHFLLFFLFKICLYQEKNYIWTYNILVCGVSAFCKVEITIFIKTHFID